jgi:hypothetical protein
MVDHRRSDEVSRLQGFVFHRPAVGHQSRPLLFRRRHEPDDPSLGRLRDHRAHFAGGVDSRTHAHGGSLDAQRVYQAVGRVSDGDRRGDRHAPLAK